MDIPTFVISLERDIQRRSSVSQQAELNGVSNLTFVTGVNGGDLPYSACNVLSDDKRWSSRKGAIGCFLSHVKVWETVATGSDDYAVILEDDVDLKHLHLLDEVELPSNAGIIFINDRMAGSDTTRLPALEPITSALLRLDKRRRGGPGSDGYLLSRGAAAAFLAACEKDLYFGHVDGRLLRYCTAHDDLSPLDSDSWISDIVRKHHSKVRVPQMGIVAGHCLSRPLVIHRGLPSTREQMDLLQG